MFITLKDLRQLKYETAVDFGQKTAGFDRIAMTPNAVWGEESFEAPASEDIDIMAPQGSDADTLGMGQTTVPAPVDASTVSAPAPAAPKGLPMAAKVGVAVVVGGLLALAYNAYTMPSN